MAYKPKTTTKTGKPVMFDEEGRRLTQSGEIDKRSELSKKRLEKARENSPVMKGQNDLGDPDDNTRRVKFVMHLTSLPPVDLNDIEALENRMIEYLQLCVNYGMKTGNQAMYLALGINKDQVERWSKGYAPTPLHSEFIKKCKIICSTFRETYMQDGKVNPVVGIFWQKNYDGLKDQQEHIVTPPNPLGDGEDRQVLQQKYLDQLPDDIN